MPKIAHAQITQCVKCAVYNAYSMRTTCPMHKMCRLLQADSLEYTCMLQTTGGQHASCAVLGLVPAAAVARTGEPCPAPGRPVAPEPVSCWAPDTSPCWAHTLVNTPTWQPMDRNMFTMLNAKMHILRLVLCLEIIAKQ